MVERERDLSVHIILCNIVMPTAMVGGTTGYLSFSCDATSVEVEDILTKVDWPVDIVLALAISGKWTRLSLLLSTEYWVDNN